MLDNINSKHMDETTDLSMIDKYYDFFAEEQIEENNVSTGSYKLLIADDDNDVHSSTRLILKNFTFEGKKLEILETYNSIDTVETIKNNPDIAIILLDVVMDEYNAGLKIVDIIRNNLKNEFVRIIIRTGQPGEAPEERVIVDYEINDYLNKTEITVQRLYTSLNQSLRAYRDLMKIERNRLGLEKIIKSSANLFVRGSVKEFFNCILTELLSFKSSALTSGVCFRGKESNDGVIYIDRGEFGEIIAATGAYAPYIGQSIQNLEEVENSIKAYRGIDSSNNAELARTENGLLIWKKVPNNNVAFIFLKNEGDEYDLELIKVFLVNYSLALDSFIANNQVMKTQIEIIHTLGDTIEKRLHETANHVRRVAEISYHIALKLGIDPAECELIKISSAMHDVGKIGIPDSILLKPGKLTEEEFEIIKSHTRIGYDMFSNSNLDVLKKAAEICLYHHERYDGNGYPENRANGEIPISARIVAVADVYDALTHIRCYKDAWSAEEATEYIKIESGHQFDPDVVNAFVDSMDQILEIISKYLE